jgi:pyruvate/2-oxoglutarate dehydrogenase complex dihydrolipoamide dehydrogenase (E3) component
MKTWNYYRRKKVVIIGGGAIGCESGYFFADDCKAKFHIIEMREELCKDSNDSQRQALLPRMKKIGIESDCLAEVEKIEKNGVHIVNKEGEKKFITADLVFYACGNRSNIEAVEKIKGLFLVCSSRRQ